MAVEIAQQKRGNLSILRNDIPLIFEMKFRDGLSELAISKKLNVSRNTIRKYLERGSIEDALFDYDKSKVRKTRTLSDKGHLHILDKIRNEEKIHISNLYRVLKDKKYYTGNRRNLSDTVIKLKRSVFKENIISIVTQAITYLRESDQDVLIFRDLYDPLRSQIRKDTTNNDENDLIALNGISLGYKFDLSPKSVSKEIDQYKNYFKCLSNRFEEIFYGKKYKKDHPEQLKSLDAEDILIGLRKKRKYKNNQIENKYQYAFANLIEGSHGKFRKNDDFLSIINTLMIKVFPKYLVTCDKNMIASLSSRNKLKPIGVKGRSQKCKDPCTFLDSENNCSSIFCANIVMIEERDKNLKIPMRIHKNKSP